MAGTGTIWQVFMYNPTADMFINKISLSDEGLWL